MTYVGPVFIEMLQKNNKMACKLFYFCLAWGGGGGRLTGLYRLPPGVKVIMMGVRFPGDKLSRGRDKLGHRPRSKNVSFDVCLSRLPADLVIINSKLTSKLRVPLGHRSKGSFRRSRAANSVVDLIESRTRPKLYEHLCYRRIFESIIPVFPVYLRLLSVFSVAYTEIRKVMTDFILKQYTHPAGDVLWVFVEPGNVVP